MAREHVDRTTLAQKFAFVFGIAFLAAGIAGFIPGITTNLYDGLEFAGDGSTAELLGVFQVSVLHNLVHLLFGVGILAAARHDTAMTYLLGSGIVYIVVFALGIFDGADWVPVNNADDLLHLVLAAGLLGAWAIAKADERKVRDARNVPIAARRGEV